MCFMKRLFVYIIGAILFLSPAYAVGNVQKQKSKDKIVMPEFPGGTKEMHNYLLTETVYPMEARENGDVGEVVVAFSVGTDGSISGVRVIKSVSEALDREAVRVVSKMPKWNPGKKNGKKMRAELTIPINFKLIMESDKYVVSEGENEGGGIWKESARDKRNKRLGLKKL